jgi:hypothetical protein
VVAAPVKPCPSQAQLLAVGSNLVVIEGGLLAPEKPDPDHPPGWARTSPEPILARSQPAEADRNMEPLGGE